ncbi:MAG TPA: type II toxin-antitoxin system VapC family toxin [Urbifossiella sp.]|nr:type II toxin-antitoxin system VapC family toxin [Urbifossiella sp.]
MTSRAVLDTSAVLAVVFDEPGAEVVVEYGTSAILSAVSYSEILAKATDRGLPPDEVSRVLASLRYPVVPFDDEHAVVAASFRPSTRHLNCSFADRACLATGLLHRLPVVTADRDWATVDLGVEVVVFREGRPGGRRKGSGNDQ